MRSTTAIDLDLFREEKGGDPDFIRQSQKARFKNTEDVDRIIILDREWRQKNSELDLQRKNLSKLTKEYAAKRRAGQRDEYAEAELKEIKKQIELADSVVRELRTRLHELVNTKIGNIIHWSVPISQNEDDKIITIVTGNARPREQWFKHHHELLHMIGGCDKEAGAQTSGSRGYFLKGVAVHLNHALIHYSMQFLNARNYTAVQPPFFMNGETLDRITSAEQNKDELYQLDSDYSKKYLIASPEQPLYVLNMDSVIDETELPVRYCGYSTCFRKEPGVHGKDTKGIFRTHQFEMIEQFCITSPDTSWEEHDAMIQTACDFYDSLGLAYRLAMVVSGELPNDAAKICDLEAFFPTLQTYQEFVSATNSTDYFARRLGTVTGTERKHVHTLHATLCATTRTMCCILENYQTETGVNVPTVLQPYLTHFLQDKTFIPFVKTLP
jgi:seryl-tRNA synthetase